MPAMEFIQVQMAGVAPVDGLTIYSGHTLPGYAQSQQTLGKTHHPVVCTVQIDDQGQEWGGLHARYYANPSSLLKT